jgi:adenosylhomocysteine nucleosidase
VARPGFITGLASEAGCLTSLTSDVRVAAMTAARAEAQASSLIDAGCDVLVSFGLAGALDRRLVPGDLIVANAIAGPDGTVFATRAVDLPGAHIGRMLGSDAPVATMEEKSRLQGLAVDMESHGVARAAQAKGVPLVIVRAIADRASSSLPRSVLAAIGTNGEPDVRRVLAALALRPWEIFALVRLAGESRAAHATLRRVAPALVRLLVGLH